MLKQEGRQTMSNLPSDQAQREQALNPRSSILVQAPAGSGKTDLLTRRFLRLLVEVDDPAQIVAITFTKAAAAEMRHRIVSKLEHAGSQPAPATEDAFSMEALAYRAFQHSQALGWNLLDQPAQLRISTIDSFCREIALQQPLLSGLGDGLGIYENPAELYRRAARRTIEQIDSADNELRTALESLLEWRDNNWNELEDLLAKMLEKRDRWIHDFVVGQQQDWDALRAQLERPFANAVRATLSNLNQLLDRVTDTDAREEALALARFACEEPGPKSPWGLAELAEIPCAPFGEELEAAQEIYAALGSFLQTQDGTWRSEKGLNVTYGFPASPRGKSGKARFSSLINEFKAFPEIESALAQISELPPTRYNEDEWQILRACFTLLRRAAAELQVVFAEVGAVDYVEVAQIAQHVLKDVDGFPSEAAQSLAGKISHILVDEFQDTSRYQHQLLRSLIAAWPERHDRSCFVVGDPMQSIYFFRDADAELFPRVRTAGLEIPGNEPLLFEPVRLKDNFRTAATLVNKLNDFLAAVFEENDGSGVTFAEAEPERKDDPAHAPQFELHLSFAEKVSADATTDAAEPDVEDAPENPQVEEIVSLVRSHLERMEQARLEGKTYRIAVLGRSRAVLAPIAEALRVEAIPFRAVDLEELSARPEVLDVLALGRALLNPCDRVAWLGVLRAPWCGLSLNDLHTLASADDPALLSRPVPELLVERISLLSSEGQQAAARVIDAVSAVPVLRFNRPTASLGTWLRSAWQVLGGEFCVDAAARVNLDLLWQSLDSLPNGEQDLLGPALDAALRSLTAQPDPEADSECGVQLMTIHKSKGLEFEVVILPELQATTRKGQFKMLSWLERGLLPDQRVEESEDVTEFLVAPLQPKGSDRSSTKAWVDRVYTERESQEMRRLLYVAATRARDELHMFARPACKLNKGGEWILPDPTGSLLATGWPGLKTEVQQRFSEWISSRAQAEQDCATAISIAASGENNLLEMPPINKPTLLRRLPAGFRFPLDAIHANAPASSVIGMNNDSLYARHEGGLLTRTLGIAVHSLLEKTARLRETLTWDETRDNLPNHVAWVTSQIRSAGLDRRQAGQIASQALEIALQTTHDTTGQWVLSPHAGAASETRWAGVVNQDVRTVQVDRVFRAGAAPLSDDGNRWWIVDYKTAHSDDLTDGDPASALPRLRALFAQQLQTYAEVLRKLHGEDAQIHAGLYYPRMLLFDWWEI
jgi:ATP-dependent exoDNAse (exonuclease V) beta subunit